jgi:hypothetical protein
LINELFGWLGELLESMGASHELQWSQMTRGEALYRLEIHS